MAGFTQILPLKSTRELKECIVESLPDRRFKIILYNSKDYINSRNPEIEAIINGQQFPIQADSCKIVRDANTLALAFDARSILMACIGKKKCDALNLNRQKLLNICQKIEDVLGKVPVIDKMKKAIDTYQVAVDNILNFHDVETIQEDK